jgi:lysozyme family protein
MSQWRILPIAGALIGALFISGALAVASNWERSVANVLVSEGGNDDDRHDPGGRTSRGIIQREWNVYRRSHPGLPADVWRAPQSAVLDIYRTKYWNVCGGDALPIGLDYTIFDYCVNSGIARPGKVLRRILKLPQDSWRIDGRVAAAINARRVADLIVAVNAERLRFLRSLATCRYYCKGWNARVISVRTISLRMASGAPGAFEMLPAFGPGKAYDRAALMLLASEPDSEEP